MNSFSYLCPSKFIVGWKGHINQVTVNAETNMVSANAWAPQTVGLFWLAEELKAAKGLAFPTINCTNASFFRFFVFFVISTTGEPEGSAKLNLISTSLDYLCSLSISDFSQVRDDDGTRYNPLITSCTTHLAKKNGCAAKKSLTSFLAIKR